MFFFSDIIKVIKLSYLTPSLDQILIIDFQLELNFNDLEIRTFKLFGNIVCGKW